MISKNDVYKRFRPDDARKFRSNISEIDQIMLLSFGETLPLAFDTESGVNPQSYEYCYRQWELQEQTSCDGKHGNFKLMFVYQDKLRWISCTIKKIFLCYYKVVIIPARLKCSSWQAIELVPELNSPPSHMMRQCLWLELAVLHLGWED